MDEYYWVDVGDAPSKEMWLRVKEATNDHPSINWASDYLMDERFK